MASISNRPANASSTEPYHNIHSEEVNNISYQVAYNCYRDDMCMKLICREYG